jgi:hypothetical protein
VAVLGSYLHSFAGSRIEAVEEFDLDAVTGDDPRAAKLARVLAYYAQRLPEEERELLARLSVFPRGVTIDLLGVLVDAGGEVAGLLLQAKPRLVALLGSLRARGLVFQYQSGEAVTWTAHPFLRERFRELLGCPAERVFDVVAQALGARLEKSPDTKPSDSATLDRYERLIEATRLAGREQEAFELYRDGLDNEHLAFVLASMNGVTASWRLSARRAAPKTLRQQWHWARGHLSPTTSPFSQNSSAGWWRRKRSVGLTMSGRSRMPSPIGHPSGF